MRFIGGKSLILPYLKELINENTKDVKVVGDLFSGSGVVSKMFKEEGYETISNDLMYFCYVLLRGTIALKAKPRFSNIKKKIGDPISFLNNINMQQIEIEKSKCFIYNNYSTQGGRMYLQEENALKIDYIRIIIEEWRNLGYIDDDEYFYLLACLIEAIPYVSNIAGVYGAYLKFWDNRSYKKLELYEPKLILNGLKSLIYNTDANELIKEIKMDLCYMDPPYNQRQYLPNYHLLETVARYDYPAIKGVTGMRDYSDQKSEYCMKSNVKAAFEDFIKTVNTKYIIISYNTEGLLKSEEIIDILKKYGKDETFKMININYNRYKNAKTQSNKSLREQLYFIEKEDLNE